MGRSTSTSRTRSRSWVDEKGKLFDGVAKEILDDNDNLLFADKVVVAKHIDGKFEDAKTIAISVGVPAGYGTVDFSAGSEYDSKTESYYSNVGKRLPVELKYTKVVGGVLLEMTAGEKLIVNITEVNKEQAQSTGSVLLSAVCSTVAALPVPPLQANLLVCVTDDGSGAPCLAVSDATNWTILVGR